MIEYKEIRSEYMEEAYKIYEENHWESYLHHKDKLTRAFEKSLYIVGAFENDRLVGFARCVGDAEYILYVQDLIVKPEYQRKGIGKELMRLVSEAFPTVRQFVLITDADDKISNEFYQAIGMSRDCNGYPINTYFRTQSKNKYIK